MAGPSVRGLTLHIIGASTLERNLTHVMSVVKGIVCWTLRKVKLEESHTNVGVTAKLQFSVQTWLTNHQVINPELEPYQRSECRKRLESVHTLRSVSELIQERSRTNAIRVADASGCIQA